MLSKELASNKNGFLLYQLNMLSTSMGLFNLKDKKYTEKVEQIKLAADLIKTYSSPDENGIYAPMKPEEVVQIKTAFSNSVTAIDELQKTLDNDKNVTEFNKAGLKSTIQNIQLVLKNDNMLIEKLNPMDHLAFPEALFKADHEIQKGKYKNNPDYVKYPPFDEYNRAVGKGREERDKVLQEYLSKSDKALRTDYEALLRKKPYLYEFSTNKNEIDYLPYYIKSTGDTKLIEEYIAEQGDKLPVKDKLRLEMHVASEKKRVQLNKELDEKYISKDINYNEKNASKIQIPKGKDDEAYISVDQKNFQSSTYGCWSCASSLLLQSRGLSVAQEEIRSFRPKVGKGFQFNADFNKAYNENEPQNILERGDSLLAFSPGNMLHELNISSIGQLSPEEKPKAKDKVTFESNYKRRTAELMKKTILHAIKKDKSPVAVNCKGHYLTIVGISGDLLTYKNSAHTTDHTPNHDHKITVSDLINEIMSANQPVTLTWLSEIKLAKDGYTIHGVPNNRLYMGDDGKVHAPKDTLDQFEKTNVNKDGHIVNRFYGDEDYYEKEHGGQKLIPFTDGGIKKWEKVYLPKQMNVKYLRSQAKKRSFEEEKELFDQDKAFYGINGEKRYENVEKDIREKVRTSQLEMNAALKTDYFSISNSNVKSGAVSTGGNTVNASGINTVNTSSNNTVNASDKNTVNVSSNNTASKSSDNAINTDSANAGNKISSVNDSSNVKIENKNDNKNAVSNENEINTSSDQRKEEINTSSNQRKEEINTSSGKNKDGYSISDFQAFSLNVKSNEKKKKNDMDEFRLEMAESAKAAGRSADKKVSAYDDDVLLNRFKANDKDEKTAVRNIGSKAILEARKKLKQQDDERRNRLTARPVEEAYPEFFNGRSPGYKSVMMSAERAREIEGDFLLKSGNAQMLDYSKQGTKLGLVDERGSELDPGKAVNGVLGAGRLTRESSMNSVFLIWALGARDDVTPYNLDKLSDRRELVEEYIKFCKDNPMAGVEKDSTWDGLDESGNKITLSAGQKYRESSRKWAGIMKKATEKMKNYTLPKADYKDENSICRNAMPHCIIKNLCVDFSQEIMGHMFTTNALGLDGKDVAREEIGVKEFDDINDFWRGLQDVYTLFDEGFTTGVTPGISKNTSQTVDKLYTIAISRVIGMDDFKGASGKKTTEMIEGLGDKRFYMVNFSRMYPVTFSMEGQPVNHPEINRKMLFEYLTGINKAPFEKAVRKAYREDMNEYRDHSMPENIIINQDTFRKRITADPKLAEMSDVPENADNMVEFVKNGKVGDQPAWKWIKANIGIIFPADMKEMLRAKKKQPSDMFVISGRTSKQLWADKYASVKEPLKELCIQGEILKCFAGGNSDISVNRIYLDKNDSLKVSAKGTVIMPSSDIAKEMYKKYLVYKNVPEKIHADISKFHNVMLGIQMDVMKCDLKTAKKNAGDWGDSDQLKNLDADLHNFMIIYRDGKPEEIRHQLREILDSAGKYLKHEKKKNRTENEEKLHKVASKLCEILPEHIQTYDYMRTLATNCTVIKNEKNSGEELSRIHTGDIYVDGRTRYKDATNKQIEDYFKIFEKDGVKDAYDYNDDIDEQEISLESEKLRIRACEQVGLIKSLKAKNKNLRTDDFTQSPDNFIEENAENLKVADAALNFVTKDYIAEMMKLNTPEASYRHAEPEIRAAIKRGGFNYIDILENNIRFKEFDKEVASLSKNPIFKEFVKQNPKNYYSGWRKIEEGVEKHLNFIKRSMDTIGLNKLYGYIARKRENAPEGRESEAGKDGKIIVSTTVDEKYNRISEYVSKQILVDPAYRYIIQATEAGYLSMGKIMKAVGAKLRQDRVVERSENSVDGMIQLCTNIMNGSIKKSVVSSIADTAKNEAKSFAERKAEATAKKSADKKSTASKKAAPKNVVPKKPAK